MGRMPVASTSRTLRGMLARVIRPCFSAPACRLALVYQAEKLGRFRGREETDRFGRIFPREGEVRIVEVFLGEP